MVSNFSFEQFGVRQFGVRTSKNGILPFAEKVNVVTTSEATNKLTPEPVKNDTGKITFNYDKFTVGNGKKTDTRNVYENIYKVNNSDYDFTIGNKTLESTEEYNIDNKTLNSSLKDEYLNQGLYYKDTGDSKNGGSIEFASNRMDAKPYQIEDENFDFDKEYKATYFNENYTAYNKDNPDDENNYRNFWNSVYKAADYDITFNTNKISNCRHSTLSSTSYSSDGSPVPYTSLSDLSVVYNYDDIKDYYELSFELTDKYLIVKNKFNASQRAFENFEYSGLSYDKLAEYLKPYEGSYLYKEVWLDYKNIFNDTDTNGNKKYQLGYAYYKYDYVEKENNEGTYDSDTMYYYGKTLNDLNMSNLIGQKYTISTTNETHVEAYLINASDNEIESKKNAFVEACKKDNFLTKYNFKKTEKTKKTSPWG
jgi:hypothetical protein